LSIHDRRYEVAQLDEDDGLLSDVVKDSLQYLRGLGRAQVAFARPLHRDLIRLA
jgi:hypothetical protein